MLFDNFKLSNSYNLDAIRKVQIHMLYKNRGIQELCKSCQSKDICAVLAATVKLDFKFFCYDYIPENVIEDNQNAS